MAMFLFKKDGGEKFSLPSFFACWQYYPTMAMSTGGRILAHTASA